MSVCYGKAMLGRAIRWHAVAAVRMSGGIQQAIGHHERLVVQT
jgi:hypothetical protein